MASILELSKKLSMHQESIRRLCRQGKINARKKGQWHVRIKIPKGKLVTVSWMSDSLQKSTDTIYAMIKTHSLSATKINGRWYICKEEALKLLQIRL
jgi:predicted RNA binding protein YcfA (HicA-like mRNA interferase family)